MAALWVGAWAVKLAAAWAAARDAARDAAWAAARAAAWAAAWDAARAAARAAAWDAARDAAWDAVRDAARDAAWDAAGAAELYVLVKLAPSIEPKHLAHAEARTEVWRRGYALRCDVNGKLCVYGVKKEDK